jgi:hypothetical protein
MATRALPGEILKLAGATGISILAGKFNEWVSLFRLAGARSTSRDFGTHSPLGGYLSRIEDQRRTS